MEQDNKSRFWRPTNRQVLWAIGMVVALLTTAFLIANLYPDIWEDLSKRRVLTLIGVGVTLTVIIVLLAIGGASLEWTGFGEQKLWNWLQLLSALAIPIVLAAAGFWFTAQQEERQQRIEAQRAESERTLEEQRADDIALQAYLDQMSTLLLEKNLRDSEEGSEVRTLARARTATVMQRLDSEGNRNVIRFLSEAGLTGAGESSISLLTDARLSGTELSGATLEGANLSEAHLYDANLSKANLHRANLQRATLGEADLGDAFLVGADLANAELQNADLRRAILDKMPP